MTNLDPQHFSPDVLALNRDLFHDDARPKRGDVVITSEPATITTLISEHDEQATLFSLAEWYVNQYPELEWLHAIPNGQYRPGQRLEPGIKSGVPDICLPVPRLGFHGFYGELKVGRNTTSDAQDRWLSHLTAVGYYTTVQYGAEAMMRAIIEYLEMPSC